SAVKVSDGNWLLQVNSTRTGTANALSLDASLFAAAGGLVETAAAQDAKITIGTGPGAYSVTASGNSFTDVLQGVTLNAAAVSATPITVSVNRDDGATADAIEKLVAQANSVISQVGIQTKYNAATKTVAPLAGDAAVRRLAEDVRAAVTAVVGGSSQTLAATMGITTQRDGTLKFDRAVFITALATDPEGTERLFNRHGSSTGGVNWAGATDETRAGTYAIEVTTAATRATTGDVLVGGSPLGQVIGVRIGATTVTYDATAGSTETDIATGLNSALAAAGLGVTAEVSGGGVRLTAVTFGAIGSFETNLDVNGAGSWLGNTGTDVAGTINGEVAIGSGQRLSLLNLGTSPARGLAVDIDEGVSGTLTPVDYQPGIAARLVHLATNLTATDGALSTSSNTYSGKVKAFNEQMTRFEERMVKLEANYRRQWTAVQTMLSSLESQGNWLTSQISSLPKNSGD
ncbi:MAG: flagellar filament capping protein FliD, partial [Acidimicrobiia bacterium]